MILKYRLKLRQILEELKPDLVHAGPIQNAAFLAAAAGFHPLVSMSWGSDMLVNAQRNWFMRMITRYTLHRSDLFFCDCNTVREKAIKVRRSKG